MFQKKISDPYDKIKDVIEKLASENEILLDSI